MSKILTHVKIADQSMCPFLGTTCRYWHCMAWRGKTEGASGYCELLEKDASTPSKKRECVPPWLSSDEKIAAEDIVDLACSGLAFDGERVAFVKSSNTPFPQVDFSNLIRTVEEKPSELAALLYDKIEKLSGKYPEGVLGKLSDNVVGSICYGIDKGVTIKEDILVLSQALVEAVSESMEY